MLTINETRAMNVSETTTALNNKHYEIGLLWKTDNPKLPMNRKLVENRLISLEERLERNPVIKKGIKKQSTSIYRKVTQKITQNKIRNSSGITNFKSHHCVLNTKKANKVRVVFDAGAKFKGISLNYNLLKNPDLLNSLIAILIRFRLGQYAEIGGIEQIFHQLQVKESHQDALRFLW